MTLTSKNALITGASRGIGRSIALGLAKSGAHIIACGRSKSGLVALDDEIFEATGRHATLIPFDLTDIDMIDNLGSHIAERFGHLDIFVHSAAILGPLTPVTHIELKDFDRLFKINFQGVWRLLRTLEPSLRASAAARAIFLTSSESVVKGRAFWGGYGMTKAAMETMVRAFADETEITTMRAILLDPGPMRTQMRASAFPGEDPLSLPHPDEIVPLVLKLCDPNQDTPTETVHFRDTVLVS